MQVCAQCVVIPNNLQICFRTSDSIDPLTILFCIRIGHGWEGVVQYSFVMVLHNFSEASKNGTDYLSPQGLVHYSTVTLLHNSLVTCKNKLSFALAWCTILSLQYCTISQNRPRTDRDHHTPRGPVHYSSMPLLHNS